MPLVDGILHAKWSLGYAGLLSTIEVGADGKAIRPYVAVYSRRDLAQALSQFRTVKIEVHHLKREHFWRLAPLISDSAVRRLESGFGWYVVAKAIK
jgi:hypothetical protein